MVVGRRWVIGVLLGALTACAEGDPLDLPSKAVDGGVSVDALVSGSPFPRSSDAAVRRLDGGAPPMPMSDAAPPARDAAPPALDAARPAPAGDAAAPRPPVDAGPPPPPVDAAPRVDVGPVCGAETCDGTDEDCDGRIDEGAACPCDLGAFGTSAYLFCAARADWSTARAACQQVGYDLAAVEDATEDSYLYASVNQRGFGDTWLGLNDRQNEGSWVWPDGAPLAYSHWDRGEPNDGGDGGEDCGVLMTRDGRESEWDDRGCGRDYSYICEASAPE
jgi:hypothetical protein